MSLTKKVIYEDVRKENSIFATAENKIYLTVQPAFTCSKSTMETPEQCVKSVQSLE